MLDLLRPIFRGDWAQYGESLQLSDANGGRPSVAQWLTDVTHLEIALTHHAATLNGARKHQAVTSDWMLRYLTALLPPIVALSSLLKYTVPASWHDMTLTLNEFGSPAIFAVGDVGTASPGADTATRYGPLLWQHLEPLIAHLARHTEVPSKILRGNARRTLLGIFDQAVLLASASPALSATLLEDRRQLLESPTWPDGRRNPLFLRHRYVVVSSDGGTQRQMLHASCCLAYQLPSTGYCGACPLAPKYRKHAALNASQAVDDGPSIRRSSVLG